MIQTWRDQFRICKKGNPETVGIKKFYAGPQGSVSRKRKEIYFSASDANYLAVSIIHVQSLGTCRFLKAHCRVGERDGMGDGNLITPEYRSNVDTEMALGIL